MRLKLFKKIRNFSLNPTTKVPYKKTCISSAIVDTCESIRRGNFAKYLFLGYDLLENCTCSYIFFEEALQENLICSYGICFLLANRMCSCRILIKHFWCVLVRFGSPRKFICVLVPFLVLLENSYVFLLHPSLLEN